MIRYWQCTRAERAEARFALRYTEPSKSAKVNDAASAWATFLLGVLVGVIAVLFGFVVANLIDGNNERAIVLSVAGVSSLAVVGKNARTTVRFRRLIRQ